MLCISSPCCCIPRIADKTFAFCPESASIGRVKLNWLPLLDAILLALFSFHPSPRNSRTLSYFKRIRRDSLRNLKEPTAHAQIHFAANSQRNLPRGNQPLGHLGVHTLSLVQIKFISLSLSFVRQLLTFCKLV